MKNYPCQDKPWDHGTHKYNPALSGKNLFFSFCSPTVAKSVTGESWSKFEIQKLIFVSQHLKHMCMNLAVWNSVHISNSPLSRSGTHFWKSLPFNMQAISTPSLQTLPVISNSEFFVSLWRLGWDSRYQSSWMYPKPLGVMTGESVNWFICFV